MEHVNIFLTENQRTILEARYLQKDEDGNVSETPEELFWRVASAIGEDEEQAREFYDMMTTFRFLPNTPTLFNAGTKTPQLAACFVLPIEDSMTGIMKTCSDMAMIQKTGGGTGFSFSRLRPKGDTVFSTMSKSSGPIAFLKMYNAVTEAIKQGGKRRGANMGIIRIDHPDIRDFITLKDSENEVLANFNISIAMTNDFMDKVIKGNDFTLHLINPRNAESYGKMQGQGVFQAICEQAWATGDPGLWFIDKTNSHDPHKGNLIESTNPCGEQPLMPYEPCNLGSINLGLIIKESMSNVAVDWKELERVVRLAIRFLDNAIDKCDYQIPEIQAAAQRYRRIGLGVMGWADLLVRMDMPYDSPAALSLAGDIMKRIQQVATDESERIAEEKGPFPGIDECNLSRPRRNINCTTIAPTGTISRIADCSSGIEPYFALAYRSHVLDGETLIDRNPHLEQVLGSIGFTGEGFWEEIERNKGRIRKMIDFPQTIRNVFVTAMELSVEAHVQMQSVFQRYTDNAVSKTINLPEDATVDDVREAYIMAYRLDCKGITIYRDKSKAVQVLDTGGEESKTPMGLPEEMNAKKVKVPTGHGKEKMHVFVTFDDEGAPREVFVNSGKAGGDTNAYGQALCRLISVGLRAGVPIDVIVGQLEGIKCPHQHRMPDGTLISSDADAIAYALKKLVGPQADPELQSQLRGSDEISDSAMQEMKLEYESSGDCPECHGTLVHQEGCDHCLDCSYSSCL